MFLLRSRCLNASGEEISLFSHINVAEFFTDPGRFTRIASTYISAEVLADSAATCSVTLGVVRKQTGVLDSAYGEGGSISANRYDTVEFNVVP